NEFHQTFLKMKRRDFIKNTAPVAILPFFTNGFSLSAYGESNFINDFFGAQVATDKVLVIIQLVGGNDGLNTVLPIDQYPNLTAARPNIFIPEVSALALNGTSATALHPSLTGLQSLYNSGKLAIVQNVGYPNPDFSHFRATDIWNTASNSNEVLSSGWLGRYLENEFPNFPQGYPNATMPDPLAIEIGSSFSTLFQGFSQNLAQTVPLPDTNNSLTLTQLANASTDPAPSNHAGDELTFVRSMMQQTNQYAATIQNAWTMGQNTYPYPPPPSNASGYRASYLGEQLRTVARLIKGGLKTRAYMVNMGSFDTHSSQVDANDSTLGEHALLLKELSDAIFAFQEDLRLLSLEDRVIGMTYSEFGRRIKANASNGTDHGAAAPMFIFGSKVNGGIKGANPVIPTNASTNDNVPMQYDFRAVYTTILQNWFCLPQTDANNVLLHTHNTLPLLNSVCAVSTADSKKAGDAYIRCFPNPSSTLATLEFEVVGGDIVLELYNPVGQRIRTLLDSNMDKGIHQLQLNISDLPVGNYYYRYQSGGIVQTKAMAIVR
ncbi:MAG: hypothetical protein RI894_1711, partial [Bacteroidota bacterium]